MLVFSHFEKTEMGLLYEKFLSQITLDSLSHVFTNLISKLPKINTNVFDNLMTSNSDMISLVCRDSFIFGNSEGIGV